MFKYKNIGEIKIIFQAGASAENPSLKKIYEMDAGQEIDVPVLITRDIPNLKLIDEGEDKPKKKKI